MTEQEAIEALVKARRIAGRPWRRIVHECWGTGGYRKHYLESIAGSLQRVRNKFGPSWLIKAKLPELNIEVVCGNIGTVYKGGGRVEAERCFREYVGQSKSKYGRASGECVTMFEDGEIEKEYTPTHYNANDFA